MRRTRMLPLALTAISIAASSCADPIASVRTEDDPQLGRIAAAQNPHAIDLAVIGDVPYGESAVERFPSLIRAINEDPHVRRVVHVGDTKSGSTVCSDAWFRYIRRSFNQFRHPMVYTPGDNEWTDCHRDNNGNWNPLERLDQIRKLYFHTPNKTLGRRSERVEAQPRYPENQLWVASGVVFVTVHMVGSNNNLAPWTCYQPFDEACPDGNAPETAEMAAARTAEAVARDAANRRWLAYAFDRAEESGAAGVVVFGQADLWHPGDVADGADFSGHQAFVELLATRSAAFADPVLLIVGDSHDYRVDQPLIGDTNYGAPDAPNLTQITVDRSIEDDVVWLRLHVDPTTEAVFSWEEVVVQ